MKKSDTVAALLFLSLGMFLAVSSFFLPEGIGNLPGPGFFPAVIGFLVILLSALLLRGAWLGEARRVEVHNGRVLAGTAALTLIYLLLWGSGGFIVRTVIFLVLLLRLFGERWRTSVAVGIVLAGVITLGFRFGLRLTLE